MIKEFFWVSLGLAAALALSPPRAAAEPKPSPVADEAPRAPAAARPPPLDGTTYDYELSPQAAGKPEKSWLGRAFVHRIAAAIPAKPLPILVFLHGTNTELIRYRWMGGGHEGDVRRIAAELMESGRVPPLLVAAPSAILPRATVVARTSWPAFDLDTFLTVTQRRLDGIAVLDRTRVIVAGHSGGGCNSRGGIATAVRYPALAALVIDTCMDVDLAEPLARAGDTTHVIVSWQTMSWQKRPFRDFKRAFRRAAAARPAAPGVLRTLERLTPAAPMPHDAMVPLVLKRWLPSLLSPDALPDIPCVSP